jgi:hypothetical protein
MTVAIVVAPFVGSLEAAEGCTSHDGEWMGLASHIKAESARPRAQPGAAGPHRSQ